MVDTLVKKIIKMLIRYLDRNGNLLAISFGANENTDYHVIVERWDEKNHTHSFGTRIEVMQ